MRPPVPPEVAHACQRAHEIRQLCKLWGIDPRAGEAFHGHYCPSCTPPERFGVDDMNRPSEYDPDVDPFFWEL